MNEQCSATTGAIEASGIEIVHNRYRCSRPPHTDDEHDWKFAGRWHPPRDSERRKALAELSYADLLGLNLSHKTAWAADRAQDYQDDGLSYGDVRAKWNTLLGRDAE